MKRTVIPVVAGLLLIILLTLASWMYYNKAIQKSGLSDAVDGKNYDCHYVFLSENPDSAFWNEAYESAREEGEQEGIYVEMMGNSLTSGEYVMEDYMKICIASKVDGIIMEGTGSDLLAELVDEAWEHDIPVVTVLKDVTQSKRVSFVGMNIYELGQLYGEQVLSVMKENTGKVMVLYHEDGTGNQKNFMTTSLTGIKSTIAQGVDDKRQIEVIDRNIVSQSPFDSEEAIRDIMGDKEQIPDILICLDETDTECAFQTLIDYNMVDEVDIIGYHTGDIILNGIQKGIIPVTLAFDASQMGRSSVEALWEYQSAGRVSNYISVDPNVITKENVDHYLNKEESGS